MRSALSIRANVIFNSILQFPSLRWLLEEVAKAREANARQWRKVAYIHQSSPFAAMDAFFTSKWIIIFCFTHPKTKNRIIGHIV